MLRLASSTVLPNALRATISACYRILSGSSQHLLVKTNSFCRHAKNQNELKLIKILESKIKSAPFIEKIMPKAPAYFPFAIEDESNMILTRDHVGEKIEIRVLSPPGDERFLILLIKISKQSGNEMQLKVYFRPENMIVNSISVMEPPLPFGVDPGHNEWQDALVEFLESRGIRNTCFEFLWESVQRKSKRRSMEHLEKMTTFLSTGG